MGEADITKRADWPFVQNGAVTLFLKQAVLDEAIAKMTRESYAVHEIDCGTEAKMVDDLAKALHWKEQFGYTPDHLGLDALNDALRGEPCNERPKLLLVLKRFAGFQKRSKDTAQKLLDIIEYQARDHLLFGHRLLAFVHSNDPRLHIDGLGGRIAQWNNQEWLMKSRGI